MLLTTILLGLTVWLGFSMVLGVVVGRAFHSTDKDDVKTRVAVRTVEARRRLAA